jgi:uncharacterized protein
MNYRHILLSLLVAGAGFVVLSGPQSQAQSNGTGPSFSCLRAAEGGAEEMICRDRELSRQDRVMASAFSRARAVVRGSEGTGALLSSQQVWLRERNNCADLRTQKGFCIEASTDRRIKELEQWAALGMDPNRATPRRPEKTGVTKGSRPPQGPSFNCANARNLVERTICADRTLSLQDRQVASLYRQLMALPTGNRNLGGFMQTEQRDYLANRNSCDRRPAVIKACLQVAHENRIARLEELIEDIRS